MAKLMDLTARELLAVTASKKPAPGGGSISALMGGAAAALTAMVARLTLGRKGNRTGLDAEMESVIETAEEIQARFEALVDRDTAAYNGVMSAFKLPKQTEEEKRLRKAQIQAATQVATETPLEMIRACGDLVALTLAVAKEGNPNAASDAGVAVLALSSASKGAHLNVRINLPTLRDEKYVREVTQEVDRILTGLDGSIREIQEAVERHL